MFMSVVKLWDKSGKMIYDQLNIVLINNMINHW